MPYYTNLEAEQLSLLDAVQRYELSLSTDFPQASDKLVLEGLLNRSP